jgi:acyl carrier protein
MPLNPCLVNIPAVARWFAGIEPHDLLPVLRGYRETVAKASQLKRLHESALPTENEKIVADVKAMLDLVNDAIKFEFEQKMQTAVYGLVKSSNVDDAKLLVDEAYKAWGLRLNMPKAQIGSKAKSSTSEASQEPDSLARIKSIGLPKSRREMSELVKLATLKQNPNLDEAKYNKDTKLVEVGVDSLDLVEFVMTLEHALNIEVPDDDAEKLISPQATIDYLLDLPEFSGLK